MYPEGLTRKQNRTVTPTVPKPSTKELKATLVTLVLQLEKAELRAKTIKKRISSTVKKLDSC